ncbi:MAG: hypothetical protein AAFZ87_18390, partial [Planctomycetota bacterium]
MRQRDALELHPARLPPREIVDHQGRPALAAPHEAQRLGSLRQRDGRGRERTLANDWSEVERAERTEGSDGTDPLESRESTLRARLKSLPDAST